MKLTQWELARVLEALDQLIEERENQGRVSKSFHRLREKVISYGAQTGKLRG